MGTPRAITRPIDNATVWKWDNIEPFGNNAANENPSGLGAFAYNLRHPGQYADAETGTFYNYFRDYDPATGRYRQSDPIGLAGGKNTYQYANSNPLKYIDPNGLKSIRCFITGCDDEPKPDGIIDYRPPFWQDGGSEIKPYLSECRIVAMVICQTTSQGLGIGMPWSIGVGQVCQVKLMRVCKKETVCEWPEASSSPFAYGP